MRRYAQSILRRVKKVFGRFKRPASHEMLPSIWVRAFSNQSDWSNSQQLIARHVAATREIDDALLSSRRPTTHHWWCSACVSNQPMVVDWQTSRFFGDGIATPQWADLAHCQNCRSNSQLRALLDLLSSQVQHRSKRSRIGFLGEYAPELVLQIEAQYPNSLVRCFSHDATIVDTGHDSKDHRHQLEDLRDSQLTRGKFDFLVLHNFLEQASNPERVLSDLKALLRRRGSLLLVVAVREPESEPWVLLTLLRTLGFKRTFAHQYWGPWKGHLGGPSFVFEAQI